MSIDARLAALGLSLPEAPRPLGKYSAVSEAGDLLYVSGQLPLRDGEVAYRGQVGAVQSVKAGRKAAALAAMNVLAQIRTHLGGFERFVKIVRVDGYVSSIDGFFAQQDVIDGASELFADVLGDQAGHARAAFSQTQLPANASVVLAVVAQVTPAA